ncbi:MAG: bifunctional phosphopantothenoylcysteine decarboxylase/phosphopantothenate--cysteine ligase CoaBC [Granulosicoccaceae bacterium]
MKDKRVLLGITGGIAAYKSAELVRLLVKMGADVRVVMSDGAQAFVAPLTFQALSGHPVHTTLLDPEAEAGMGHIELARWAELFLIAPATANTLADIVAGRADQLLTTTVLATAAPVWVAPAMNQQMWANPATQANIATLQERGIAVLGPAAGEQACGDVGAGRMLEPAELAALLAAPYTGPRLDGVRALLTAGPTREAVDPVRYLSNHSSGKMGYAVARALVAAGAEVTLVSGPTGLSVPHGVEVVQVESAQDMLEAVQVHARQTQLFVATAAVADYRVAEQAEHKIKKTSEDLSLALARNPDILAHVASLPDGPVTVGFAAETQQVAEYARGKLERKNLDMICANLVLGDDSPFGSDHNALEVFFRDGSSKQLPRADKGALAASLVALIAQHHFSES